MTASIHPRHTTARTATEHMRIAKRYRPSARDLFAPLRTRLLASRPVVGSAVRASAIRNSKPKRGSGAFIVPTVPVYGPPTFRNSIDPATGELR